eukprot:PITA_03211
MHGIDYDEIFAPVAKMDSIRLALVIAAAQGWEVHQMDVKNAFLHGDLSEDIYMEQPHGFIQNSSLVVGSLLYLTHSKPDLSYAVEAVFRYMQKPHKLHWNSTKHILRYVQGTINFRIHYAVGTAMNFFGFTDSDWARNSIDRKSTFGYSLSIGSGPLCWSSKKQAAIALYSAETKYR